MKKYIKHFITITKHMYYVRKFCFKCGFYKRGLLHDLSKYSPIEFFSSARYFQGTSSPIDAEKKAKGYSLAWQHHKGHNPHHKLTVLEHCKKTEEILNKQNGQLSIPINFAGRLHDIGKLKTKTFINSKGEKANIAHFYNHEKVSAYDSLFYVNLRSRIEMMKDEEFVLETIKLIQWHMLPWTKMAKKTEQKYKKLLGENFWNDLMILHKADEEAH